MTNDFVLYQKFTGLEAATAFTEELQQAGIDFHLVNNNHSYLNIYGTAPVDFMVGVNLRQQDFTKADAVLENFYKTAPEDMDDSYYLFQYTDAELEEVVYHPLDHGRLDVVLAHRLLAQRGVAISGEAVAEKYRQQVAALQVTTPVPTTRLVLTYLLCVLMPPAALFMGLLMVNSANMLPDGSRFYTRPEGDRRHGRRIIALSAALSFLYIARLVWVNPAYM